MSGHGSAESDLQTLASVSPSASASGASAEPFALAEGQRFGRYTVLGRIGSGGMGVVYAAFDATLDRKVALKLLHRSSDAADRLGREARATAKLNHPNIVTIHDVGSHEGAVYMAMEFAEGRTLRRWLADTKPDHAQILEVFIQAGEGLAAAHATRLVHRDFKPENVMVTDDRRAKVMDFGLARAATDTGSQPVTDDAELDSDVTDGTLVGTPGYMAPEQFVRGPLTEQTDQFAFCVALYEALYGRRPFVSDQLRHRLDATIEDAPPGATVPARLRAVIVRGLARRMEDRHPDMRALLDALRSHPRRRRRVVLAGFVGGTLVVAAGIGLGLDVMSKRRCAELGDALAQRWNDDARAALERDLLATEAPYAAVAAERMIQRFDTYAEQWRETRTQVCLANERWNTNADAQSEEARCLEALRVDAEELLEAWPEAGAAAVIRGPRASANLPPPDRCLDPDYLARHPELPLEPEARQEHDRIAREVRRATYALELGERGEPLVRLEAAVRDAAALGHDPLLAHAEYNFGRSLHVLRRHADAQPHLEAAYFLAGRIRHDGLAAKAAALLAKNTAVDGPSPEVDVWAQNAEMMAERGDIQRTWDYTYVLADLAIMYDGIGDLDRAVALLRRSYALEREIGTPFASEETPIDLGEALRRQGKFEEAEAMFDEGIALTEEISGPDHPDLAVPLLDRGSLFAQTGRFEEALVDLRRAERIAQHTEGRERPLILVLGALGAVQAELGDYEGALREQRRALVLQTEESGADHPDVATWHMNLGVTLAKLGEYAEAHEHYDRAIAIRTATFGADHPALVSALVNLGELHRREHALDASVTTIERALAIAQEKLRPGHPMLLAVLASLGETLVERGDHARASALLREALRTAENDTPPATRSALEHLLALAIAGGAGTRVEAEALAHAAAHRLEETGADPTRLQEIRAWLDER